MKNRVMRSLALLCLLALLVGCFSACGSSETVFSEFQQQMLIVYGSNVTIEQAVENLFDAPSWSTGDGTVDENNRTKFVFNGQDKKGHNWILSFFCNVDDASDWCCEVTQFDELYNVQSPEKDILMQYFSTGNETYYTAFCESLEAAESSEKSEETVITALPEETSAVEETQSPVVTPAPEEVNRVALTALLEDIYYCGNAEQCQMTAEMATAYASLLHENAAGTVMAALFDGGDGLPLLWIAWGDDGTWLRADMVFQYAISDNYHDCVYRFENGAAVECKWITSLLRAGDNGVVVQKAYRSESDFAYNIRLYSLSGGAIQEEPFATGIYDPINGSTLNGQFVGDATELDLYRLADPDLDILLDASSGLSGMLILSGNWVDGSSMEEALTSYAAVLS